MHGHRNLKSGYKASVFNKRTNRSRPANSFKFPELVERDGNIQMPVKEMSAKSFQQQDGAVNN
jgi:hypothetical protein